MDIFILIGISGLFVVALYFVGYSHGVNDQKLREAAKSWANKDEA